MRTKAQLLIVGMAVVFIVTGLTGCPIPFTHDFADQPYTETRDFAPGGQLNVESLVGDVTVTAWDQDSVSITYRKHIHTYNPWLLPDPEPTTYFDQMAVEIEASANTPGLTVREVMSVSFEDLYSPSITLDIKMPSHAILNITQHVGDVTVAGIHGALDIQANVGDVDIHHPAPLADDTVSSEVVQVGDATLYVPESSAFDVVATALIGDISADDFWSINVQQEGFTGAHATGRVNGGGANIALNVNVGDIAFLRE